MTNDAARTLAESITIHEECLGAALDRCATDWGDETGWVFEDRRISYSEMKAMADRVARALLASGVRHGDIVAVWSPNLPEFAAIQFACGKIGAIIAGLNTRFKTFEAAHVLAQSEARVLIMVERFLKHDYPATLAELGIVPDGGRCRAADYPALEWIVSLEPEPAAEFLPWTDFLGRGDGVPESELAAAQAALHWSEPVLLQYTSGTTAAPKGALLNHRYALNVGQTLFFSMGVRRGEPILNTQPFYHIGGTCGALPTPLIMGCPVVIPLYYDAERVLQLIQRERCVARTGFAAMYIMEMSHPNFGQYDTSSLRAGWCSGTPEVIRMVGERMNIPYLMLTYSSTEVGGTTSVWCDSFEQRSTTSGRPITGTEVRIIDPETGADKPVGEPGEVLMRGWWQMNGYHRDPVQTAKAIDAEGWVHTGDRGSVDAAGCLKYIGRYKDMLKVGGENVAAEEIEGALLSHPKIRQAAIIGAPDPRLEEVPLAIVELHEGQSATDEEIIGFCASRMANFRVPRHIRYVTEWPLTGSGKIQKHILRDIYAPEFVQLRQGAKEPGA